MRVAYARVSTTTGEQLSALEHQIKRLVDAGVDRVISDVESGLSNDRPGMTELLHLIDSGLLTEVVATRIDRLGRDATATDSLIVLAGKRGVRITTLDGGEVESQTPTGFLMARISTSLAEMESKMLSLRIRRGLEQRRKQGYPCRGRAPWGYLISEDKTRFLPNPEVWEDAKQFVDLMRSLDWRMGGALERSRGTVPLSSIRSVRAWLTNPVLRGGVGYMRDPGRLTATEVIWDLHEPLICPEDWDLISAQLDHNRRQWGANANQPPKLLTGLCKCPNCGKCLSYAGNRSIQALLCKTKGCVSNYKSTHESVIVAEINKTLSERADRLVNDITEEPPEAEQLRQQIAQLESLRDPDLAGAISAKYKRFNEVLKGPGKRRAKIANVLRNHEAWAMATPKELRAVYLECVHQVEADRGTVVSVLLRL